MPSADRTEIRRTRKDVVLGTLAGGIMRLWAATLRVEVRDEAGVNRPPAPDAPPLVMVLWHDLIFTIPAVWRRTAGRFHKVSVLTSASNDGTILASAMAVFGLGAIRGSTSRRAVAALVGMRKALRGGMNICITPDGPRGPRHVCQPGVVKLAESSGAMIVPVHAEFSSAWRLKTWDRLVLPKPFSRVKVTYGPMLAVPPGLGEDEFEAQRARIEAILLAGAATA